MQEAIHNTPARRYRPKRITLWLPSTAVAATSVKNPTPVWWSIRSRRVSFVKKVTLMRVIPKRTANAKKFTTASERPNQTIPESWQATATIPVAMTRAK